MIVPATPKDVAAFASTRDIHAILVKLQHFRLNVALTIVNVDSLWSSVPGTECEVERMIRISSILVEECADDSWLSFAIPSWPNANGKVQERQRLDENVASRKNALSRSHSSRGRASLEVERRAAQRDLTVWLVRWLQVDLVQHRVGLLREDVEFEFGGWGGGWWRCRAGRARKAWVSGTRSVSRGRGRGQVRRGTRSAAGLRRQRGRRSRGFLSEPKFVVPPNSVVGVMYATPYCHC